MNQKITPQKTELQRIGEAALDADIAEESIEKFVGNAFALTSNTLELDSLIAELTALLPNAPKGVLELFNGFFNLLYASGQLICLDVDGSATSATELRVLFKPTDSFRNLVTALRTRNFESLSIEINRHDQ